MSDTLAMKVLHAIENLFEAAFNLAWAHPPANTKIVNMSFPRTENSEIRKERRKKGVIWKILCSLPMMIDRGHVPFLDRSIQVPTRAKLHDFAPRMILILNQVDSLNDVRMVESRRDAEFCGQFLDVLLL